ncbi:MAG TPA: glutaredoxin family protein [Jiangellales bacterium]|nr:glutaredoxin family protein [Jiangellales bacterium]
MAGGDSARSDPTGSDPGEPRVLLLGKPGCHLCDEARVVVARVCEALGVAWAERSILDDPALEERFWEQIPVTLVDGVQHDFWRVDEARLRAALT